ncbi:MAG: hypothetical protein ABWX96_18455 [Propionibacteriaceae bacterium]
MDTFPKARQGYDRAAVDAYVASANRQLTTSQQEIAALRADQQRLAAELAALRAQHNRWQTEGVDARTQDLLDAAAAQAQEIVAQGEREADEIVWEAQRRNQVLDERSRQEHAWRRRQLQLERTELARQQQALRHQLSSFRSLAVDTAARFPDLSELSFADVGSSVTRPLPSEQHV